MSDLNSQALSKVNSVSIVESLTVKSYPEGGVKGKPLSPQRTLEVTLACVSYVLLYSLLTLVYSVGQLDSIFLNSNLFLLSNLVLATVLAIACNYFSLSESAYSLGKALLVFTVLLTLNGFTLLAGGLLTWPMGLFMTGLFTSAAFLSAGLQYQLGQPYRIQKSESCYCQFELGIKRGIDLMAGIFGLTFLLPLLSMTCALICKESQGAAIYAQTRIGLGEEKFKMYKFRSMVKDADKMGAQTGGKELYKQSDDPRITRIGKLIRKLSIDELPQLWNVVKGDMSLVGPRPPIESEYDLMSVHHKQKFKVKPGLTGLWQIKGRVNDERHFNDVATYDIAYMENWCLMEDLKILLATIPVVLFQRGAC